MWRFLAVHSFRPFVFTGDCFASKQFLQFSFLQHVSVCFCELWLVLAVYTVSDFQIMAHPESWKSYMFLSVWHRCPQAPVTGFFHFWAPNLTTAYNCPAKTKLGLNLVSRVESPAFQFFSGGESRGISTAPIEVSSESITSAMAACAKCTFWVQARRDEGRRSYLKIFWRYNRSTLGPVDYNILITTIYNNI